MTSRWIALLAALLSGCVVQPPAPEFPVQRPSTWSDTSKSIAIVGDLQITPWFVRTLRNREFNKPEQDILMADLEQQLDGIGLLAIVGDLVFSAGSRRDWRRFDAIVGPIASRIAVLPAIGNHDYYCVFVQICIHNVMPKNMRLRFPWMQPGRPYLVPYGKVALIFIDSETAITEQGRWLRETLATIGDQFKAALILMHRPPYTESAGRGLGPDENLQEHIVEAMSNAPFLTVFVSGHAHGYEHLFIDGIHYVISAGGGGPRDAVSANRPNDVYRGRDCQRYESGGVLRPFNYLMITPAPESLNITVRGLCKDDAAVDVLESFEISY